MRLRVIFSTLLLSMWLAVFAFGQTLPKGVEKKASIGGFTSTTIRTAFAWC